MVLKAHAFNRAETFESRVLERRCCCHAVPLNILPFPPCFSLLTRSMRDSQREIARGAVSPVKESPGRNTLRHEFKRIYKCASERVHPLSLREYRVSVFVHTPQRAFYCFKYISNSFEIELHIFYSRRKKKRLKSRESLLRATKKTKRRRIY